MPDVVAHLVEPSLSGAADITVTKTAQSPSAVNGAATLGFAPVTSRGSTVLGIYNLLCGDVLIVQEQR
ncbi:hypothetical protein L209DRAFT_748176 [Thermothelomyces heterothallicus CBS 203.75]